MSINKRGTRLVSFLCRPNTSIVYYNTDTPLLLIAHSKKERGRGVGSVLQTKYINERTQAKERGQRRLNLDKSSLQLVGLF